MLGGSGGTRTLTITPAANQSGTATITVRVTDPGGLFAEDTFLLTVCLPQRRRLVLCPVKIDRNEVFR